MQVKFLGDQAYITWNVTKNSSLPISYEVKRYTFDPPNASKPSNRTINSCPNGNNSCQLKAKFYVDVIYCVEGSNKFGIKQKCSRKLNAKKEGNG